MPDGPSGSGLPRRRILRALALAPAALAGCAGATAERAGAAGPREGDAATPPSPRPAPAPAPANAVAAVRAFQLAADAEPAFSFRAAASRPGDPR
jgi:hypothetical protein